MSRIELKDDMITSITKMSEGNPGAMSALMAMMQPEANEIDPDAFMGPIGNMLLLDTLEIYGTDIYILYNDICNRDLILMFAVLRANQLGFLSAALLKDACHRQDRSGKEMIDAAELHKQVKKELPNFANF